MPHQVNKLVELLSIASPYARASYHAKKHPHVIICGSMTTTTIHDFLEEFFHPDHGHQDTKVIIMGNTGGGVAQGSAALRGVGRCMGRTSSSIYLHSNLVTLSDWLRMLAHRLD